MKMFVITSLVLTRFFFAIVAHPQITTAPYLVARQAGNDVCGYYSLDGTTYPITCLSGNDCTIATTNTPAFKYCAISGIWSDTPVTTQFGYGYWPADGCGPGQGCCTKSPQSLPSAGMYTFDGGSTVLLGCDTVAFTYPAFELDSATLSPETTPTSTTPVVGTAGSSSRPTGSAATSPASSTSSSTTSSSGGTTVEIVLIVVGAVVFVISLLVFIHFLTQVYKVKYQKDEPSAQTPLNPNGAPQSMKGLDKWSKIAGIVSASFGLASLAVAIVGATR